MTDSRGSALGSVAVLLLSFGGLLMLHEWSLVPAPQHLLPLLLVYIGVRGALNTQRGARVVSVLIAIFGLIAQAGVFQDLPDSEMGLLRPMSGILSGLEGAFGVMSRVVGLGLLVGGGVLFVRSRRAARRESAARLAGSGAGGHATPDASAAPLAHDPAPASTPAAATGEEAAGDRIEQFALFSGGHRSVVSRCFRGGRLVASFGGLELDLTQAVMARPEARLDVWCVFGGASIVVPKGCEVVVQAVPIFGGIDVHGTKRPLAVGSGDAPQGGRIVIGGLALFGGIDIQS